MLLISFLHFSLSISWNVSAVTAQAPPTVCIGKMYIWGSTLSWAECDTWIIFFSGNLHPYIQTYSKCHCFNFYLHEHKWNQAAGGWAAGHQRTATKRRGRLLLFAGDLCVPYRWEMEAKVPGSSDSGEWLSRPSQGESFEVSPYFRMNYLEIFLVGRFTFGQAKARTRWETPQGRRQSGKEWRFQLVF